MLDDLIRLAIQQDASQGFKSRTEATNSLKEFLELPRANLKVGDFIELNEHGKKRYNFPKPNQAAVVTRLLPEDSRGDREDDDDIAMTVAIGPNNFKVFTVDSRFYQIVSEKNNIFNFRKK